MINVEAAWMTPQMRALFAGDVPAGLRRTGVLESILPGEIWIDNVEEPSWGFIRETTYGTLYPGGTVDWEWLSAYILELRKTTETLVGMWRQEAQIILGRLPFVDYQGTVLDYANRSHQPLEDLLRDIPTDCDLRRVDETLFDLLDDRDGIVAAFGSKEKALASSFGACLLVEGEVVSEAFGGPPIQGVIEAGVSTHPDHRRKGYATLTSALLLQLCESAGYETYWNVNAENTPSVALAKRLGYRTERAYTLFAWFPKD